MERASGLFGDLEATCRRHGLPLTMQRRVVIEALARRSDHPTADQVLEDVREHAPEISRTTVYRVLEAFVAIGVARKACHPGAAARYEVARPRHHHLVCLRCEAMVDLDEPSLDALPVPDLRGRFHVEDYTVQFRGLCARCAKLERRRAPRPGRPRAANGRA